MVITVPTSLIRTLKSQMHKLEAISNIFLMFHPLFCQAYDSITVVIKDTPGSRSLRINLDLLEDSFMDCYAMQTMHQLADTTTHSTFHTDRYFQRRYDHVRRYRRTVDAPDGDLLANLVSPPPRRVRPNMYSYERAPQLQTNRIAIAYDFRPTVNAAADVKLTGELYKLTYSPSRIFLPAVVAASSSAFYEMTSGDSLVGEMGLRTGNGWALSHVLELEALMCIWRDCTVRSPCRSEGIGRTIELGDQ